MNIFHTPAEQSNPVSGRDTVSWVDIPKGVVIPPNVDPCTPTNILIFEKTSCEPPLPTLSLSRSFLGNMLTY